MDVSVSHSNFGPGTEPAMNYLIYFLIVLADDATDLSRFLNMNIEMWTLGTRNCQI
jgi:hypothetical protein